MKFNLVKALSTPLLLFLISCSNTNNKNEELSRIEDAYKSSKTIVSSFLDKWALDSKVLSNPNPSELEKEFLLIHQAVFSPFDYKRFGWDDEGWAPFSGTKYVVVQTDFPFKKEAQIDSLKREITFSDTLKSIYPIVNFKDVKTLFLTPRYKSIFKEFFGDIQTDSLGYIDREIFWEKKAFFKNYLPLSLGYDYRIVLTQPLITGIQISNDYQNAIVGFELMQSGLRSILKKQDSKWVIVRTLTLWIE